MNVLIHKRNKPDDGIITFPHLQCWNPVTKVATIAAQVSGRRVSCRVKINDLKKKFHISPEDPMHLVTKFRTEIQIAARKLIENDNYETDGSIMIDYTDL